MIAEPSSLTVHGRAADREGDLHQAFVRSDMTTTSGQWILSVAAIAADAYSFLCSGQRSVRLGHGWYGGWAEDAQRDFLQGLCAWI